jgi:leucyl aminopeptidase
LEVIVVLKKVFFLDKFPKNTSLAVGVYSDGSLTKSAANVDAEFGGVISKNLKKAAFSGKLFESFSFISAIDPINHFVMVGLGEKGKQFSEFELKRLGATIYTAASKLDAYITIALEPADVGLECNCSPAFVAFGALLKSWTFDKYKTNKKENIKLETVSVFTSDPRSVEKCFSELKNIAEGIFLTRLVVSEPANVVYPKSLAEIAQEELSHLGVTVKILDQSDMKKLKMNALLGVAQGSNNGPQLVILQWNGGNKSDKQVAFIGKGVTFDSGGISLKPGDNMHEMRCDMAGSGTVLGLMKAIALNKLPVNVVGIMALVENMPSGAAQRPGDVVTSMSGQTIEVLNTDAEGRLVLADALWYTQSNFSPEIMIDLATLTGAIVVALGHEFAGLFSNNDDLANKIIKSSISIGEKVWRLPLTDHFDQGINSDIADMQNIAKSNIRGGSITAAQFLKRFVNGVDWAHIDIAGVESTSDDDVFVCAKGATGFGVHLLYRFLQDNYVK